jgi:hypothetical protein
MNSKSKKMKKFCKFDKMSSKGYSLLPSVVMTSVVKIYEQESMTQKWERLYTNLSKESKMQCRSQIKEVADDDLDIVEYYLTTEDGDIYNANMVLSGHLKVPELDRAASVLYCEHY